MAKSAWYGGKPNFQIGQSDVFVLPIDEYSSWDDEYAAWQTLGRTDHVNFSEIFEWGDLKSIQTGSLRANAQLIGQGTKAEMGLVELYAEIAAAIIPGVTFNGGRVMAAKALGTQLTDKMFWMKFVQYRQGRPSTDIKDTIYAVMAAAIESLDINSDLSQQVVTIPFEGFEASEHYVPTPVLDKAGRPLLLWTAEVA